MTKQLLSSKHCMKSYSTICNKLRPGVFTGRYQSLSPFIEKSFDFPLIAKVILSRHWNKLNEDEQAQFIDRFTELTKTTYAARFNAYSDEAFKTLGTEQLRKGRLLVKTEIQSSADKARLNYLMHPVDNEWLIISVIANGVNDLSLKRAEYSRIISQDSFTGLLDIINAKITELRAAEDLSS